MCGNDSYTADRPTRFGLRATVDGAEVRLLQIAGSGRIRLGSAGHRWWSNRTAWPWEACEATEGQLYRTRNEAETVGARLRGSRSESS